MKIDPWKYMEQASEGEKWKQQEWTRKINSHTLQRGPVLFYQIFIKMILNIKYLGGGGGRNQIMIHQKDMPTRTNLCRWIVNVKFSHCF